MKDKSPAQLPRCVGCGRRVHSGEVVAFDGDGRVTHKACPHPVVYQVTCTLLSETAEALLSLLRTLPQHATCENCAASYLQVDRHDALKVIRELILNGHILCSDAPCSICHDERVVARLRGPSPLSSRDRA
jgi:hypothetical protein